jgi:hypothetical protein
MHGSEDSAPASAAVRRQLGNAAISSAANAAIQVRHAAMSTAIKPERSVNHRQIKQCLRLPWRAGAYYEHELLHS